MNGWASFLNARCRTRSDFRRLHLRLASVRLKGARAVDELLLTVAEREATAAERETWVALLNHQILIRRRWPEA